MVRTYTYTTHRLIYKIYQIKFRIIWHSSELWYFFGTLKNGWRPFAQHDYDISDAMATALCNFAKTGNPNEAGSDLWKPTTEKQPKMMLWGEKMPQMGKPNKFKMWYTMFTNKAVGE